MRIYELGKELNVDSKAIIGFLGSSADGKELTSMSAIPDSRIQEVRNHFTPNSASEKKSEAPKAAPLPDYIVRQVEAQAKAAEEKETQEVREAAPKKEQHQAAPEQKKKKIIAVFNPQHASSDKAKAIARQQQDGRNQNNKKKVLGKRVPARDRIPDDEKQQIKRPLPSQVRPARDRIPDDELREMEAAKRLAAEQKEAPEQEIKEAVPAQEAPKAPEETATQAPVTPVPVSKEAPEKPEQEKPRESEAVKSLREKIVKGTVSVSDLQISKRPAQGGKKDGSTDQAGHEWSTVRRAPCVKMFNETDPDIIMLQECRREELNDLKADLGGYEYYSYAKDGVLASGYSEGDATNDASFKNGGQRDVIMLRSGMFEMTQWGRFWLSDTPDVPSTGFGTTGQKITLWLKLRHRESNTLFYVFNTHFIPQTYATEAVPDCISPSGRVNIEQIKAVLGDKTSGGKGDCPETVFFAGDMNAPNTDERMAVVNDYMYCSRVSAPESDNSMTYNGFRTDPATWYNLDHIYYKNATPLVFKVVSGDGYGTRFISDHFPVYSDFRVNIR